MRKRKLVGHSEQEQQNCRIPFQHWLDANQCPTLVAMYRHLGFVESYLRVYSNSAAL